MIYDTQARVNITTADPGISTTFDGSIITNKTTCMNPQELITKQYVDGLGPNTRFVALENKPTNQTAVLNTTLFAGTLLIKQL